MNLERAVNDKIDEMNNRSNSYQLGRVVKVEGFIIEVQGLLEASFHEKVEITGKAFGYITSISNSSVIVALLKTNNEVIVGDEVKALKVPFMVHYSENAIGHVFDIFGQDKMNNEYFADTLEIDLNTPNISIMKRSAVSRPFYTGIAGIDLIYPIGKGQRQLVIGDKKTGKTQIFLDTIANQKDKRVLCIYIAIGKTKKEIKEIYNDLLKRGAMPYTLMLVANNDETPAVLSLTPYAGLAIAEKYMLEGTDVFVAIDDLKRHADAYREMSLMMGKVPGRDAYPPDIFYTYSRLLEKGCQHIDGGSITILPAMETKGGDITDYISTNIISITEKGQKPAIHYGLSVSRLGGAVQSKKMKKAGTKIRRNLLSYLENRDVYELANEDELSADLQKSLNEGKTLLVKFNQYKYDALTPEDILERFGIINED